MEKVYKDDEILLLIAKLLLSCENNNEDEIIKVMDEIIEELKNIKNENNLNLYKYEIIDVFFEKIDLTRITLEKLVVILNKISTINGNEYFVLPEEIISLDDYYKVINNDRKLNIKKILLSKMSFDKLFQEKDLIEFYIENFGKKKFIEDLCSMMKDTVVEFNLIDNNIDFLKFKNKKKN